MSITVGQTLNPREFDGTGLATGHDHADFFTWLNTISERLKTGGGDAMDLASFDDAASRLLPAAQAAGVVAGLPTAGDPVAKMSDVAAVIAGLSWKEPVLSTTELDDLAIAPPPTVGNRYCINGVGANGFVGHDYEIATCTGTGPFTWSFEVPQVGWAVWDLTIAGDGWVYNGAAWGRAFGREAAEIDYTSGTFPPLSAVNVGAALDELNDTLNLGFPWHIPVIDSTIVDSAAIVGPSPGDRYLINGIGVNDFLGHDNEFAVWNGFSWFFLAPQVSHAVVIDITNNYHLQWDLLGGMWMTGFGLGVSSDGSHSHALSVPLASTSNTVRDTAAGVGIQVFFVIDGNGHGHFESATVGGLGIVVDFGAGAEMVPILSNAVPQGYPVEIDPTQPAALALCVDNSAPPVAGPALPAAALGQFLVSTVDGSSIGVQMLGAPSGGAMLLADDAQAPADILEADLTGAGTPGPKDISTAAVCSDMSCLLAYGTTDTAADHSHTLS